MVSDHPPVHNPQRLTPGAVGAAFKRVFLGKPLITAELRNERLSNRVALGVLSPDAISSSAYGPEQMLVELLPVVGAAAFALVLPITGLILLILVLVTASYRQVVMVYTQAGGSYVVARDNFGPRVAQVAAAALLIDYVVTVAVQAAAGTVAVVSAVPFLGPYSLEITIGVVLVLCYANLRGLREAGRTFAVPTYVFAGLVSLMIVVGLVKAATTGLPVTDSAHLVGAVPLGHLSDVETAFLIFALLRSFANGGSSLTGVEAISNTVSVFREPRGQNARKVLLRMAFTLGFLVAGVSFLAFLTHATPYQAGYPSVLSQEARAVFGTGAFGQVMFVLIQAATALILYTGANTSFNGFPFLASFVATDRFLPRQLTTRGHRLVYSNGIIVLTVLAVALLFFSGGTVTALVPFYAIGVFTGFAMAGYGMSAHHRRVRGRHWRGKLAINLSAAILSTAVVGIFAIFKFTEGAWLIVIVFPALVAILIRLNREYRAEAEVLEHVTGTAAHPVGFSRHRILVFVNNLDLAVVEAMRYGATLHADELIAVHLVLDTDLAARIRHKWEDAGMDVTLRMVDVPDRRLARAAYRMVSQAIHDDPSTGVTVLLPRRSYAPFLGRLLHDRTADRIARAISRIPQAAATIIPFDVQQRIRAAMPHLPEERMTESVERWVSRTADDGAEDQAADVAGSSSAGRRNGDTVGIAAVGRPVKLRGRILSLTYSDPAHTPDGVVTSAEVADGSGSVEIAFHRSPDGLEPGQLIDLAGVPQLCGDGDATRLLDPSYTIVDEGSDDGQ